MKGECCPQPSAADHQATPFTHTVGQTRSAARGQVSLYDEETFELQNWASVFVGHGLIPRDYSPVVDEMPREQAVEKFQNFLGLIADEVRAMPTVDAYLRGAGSPAPPQPRGLY